MERITLNPETLNPWLDHVDATGSRDRTDTKHHKLDGLYFSPVDWCRAQHLILDHLANTQVSLRRGYARRLSKDLNSAPFAELAATDRALIERARKIAAIEDHGNSDGRTYTLWHIDGGTATGTRRQLMTSTGVPAMRLKELINGRRRLVAGWCLTEGEARRGRLPPGRPKKQKAPEPCEVVDGMDIFEMDTGATLF